MIRALVFLVFTISTLVFPVVNASDQDRVWALVDDTRAVIYCQIGKRQVDYKECPAGPALITNIVRRADGITDFTNHEGILEFNLPDGLTSTTVEVCGMIVESPTTVGAIRSTIRQVYLEEMLPDNRLLVDLIESNYHIKSPQIIRMISLRDIDIPGSTIIFFVSNKRSVINACSNVYCPYYNIIGVMRETFDGHRSSRIISAQLDDVLTDAGAEMIFDGFAVVRDSIALVFQEGLWLNHPTRVVSLGFGLQDYPHSRCN